MRAGLDVKIPDGPVDYTFTDLSTRGGDASHGSTLVRDLSESTVFEGTWRKIWLHLPPNMGGDFPKQHGVVFFQDGGLYVNPEGPVRATLALDELSRRGLIPPTVGVFVDPGWVGEKANPAGKNRNVEYDTFSDRYVTFLRDEVMPAVESWLPGVDLGGEKVICGGSSGGNAALTAAYHCPDFVSRVVSFVGSFTQIPGGNPFPQLAKAGRMPSLRIFMQAAQFDLGWGNPEMNWFAENLRTSAALSEAGLEFRLVVGDGGHSPNHGGVLLPRALEWVFGGQEA